MQRSNFSSVLRAIRWISIALIIGIGGWMVVKPMLDRPVDSHADIGGNFTLLDQNGKVFTQKDLLGKPYLLYFGYTYCPDVCPTALQQMGAAIELVGADATKFNTVFITIDPQRDTVELMAQYVKSNGFPAGLIGLSGTAAQIEKIAKAWTMIYRRSAETRGEADYLMDHTSIIYFHDANGKFVSAFSHRDSPQIIANCLNSYLDEQPCRR
ncbi:Cytochrome oxidase biogenesis protein Sco1/SenC/PrrC, thiol-disulfide reductase involved in Cu(I) insertion into CoxII Cu(A) center [hydrothermal vent metagenome]|uniref:Cytochrome oxidase biogenesis protein Sco1/SenC/PrrC, thiol-disulfide reductase involved in Cu(I) insertion into CoxII Cu(A) center n=1 Tax=hydrothermal vent metagenome TaxID=652676 RepID=A0A3B0R7Y7_9ZZZZ